LLASIIVSIAVGLLLLWLGRNSQGHMFRKEAMAVVGLSWILATVLGALPFYFSGTYRCASVRLFGENEDPLVHQSGFFCWRVAWAPAPRMSPDDHRLIEEVLNSGAVGMTAENLQETTGWIDAPQRLERLVRKSDTWARVIILPGQEQTPADRVDNYRIRWVKMGIADSLFESQSGFSTTGATVIADLEDPQLVPHCILFWRSSTHFLGGLGIIVVFVVILGQGSAGKALMRAEMPGPTKEGATARMQHTAWLFAGTYCALNIILAVILYFMDLTVFDALCHAFGTMATGGFSTYNASLGHFNSPLIEYTVILFMILAGSNFTLLFLFITQRSGILFRDIEWRTFVAAIGAVASLVVIIGLAYGDFSTTKEAVRFGLFQVVSIITTTGYGTSDFDTWNSFARASLFLLMFVGGCAGSTGGGLKVIRHILFFKILRLEIEQAYHPSIVRPLKLSGKPVEDPELHKNILVYFALILVIFVMSWMFVVTLEPDVTWGKGIEHKLIDSASGVAATLNNIGPGLGTVGATQNYTFFSPLTKTLFVWLMMIGRLEIFSILVLFSFSFWRNRP
jgi:trk system potassium uptake protein TrkH